MNISNDQAQKEYSIGIAQSSQLDLNKDTIVVAMNDTRPPSDDDPTHDADTTDEGDALPAVTPAESSQDEDKKLSLAASIAYIHLIGLTTVNVLLLLPLAPKITRVTTAMDNTQMILDEALLTAESDQIDQIEEVTEAFDRIHAFTQTMARVMALSGEVKDLAFAAMDALAEGNEEEGLRVYKEAVAKHRVMKREIQGAGSLVDGI